MRLARAAALFLALTGAHGAAHQTVPQPARLGTGVISGSVRDATSGAPLRAAMVSLGPANRLADRTPTHELTDDKGRFVFAGLPAAKGYVVRASRPGYFAADPSTVAGVASEELIDLTAGEWFSAADLSLMPQAAIAGRVEDEAGDPLADVFVRVLRRVTIAGRTQLAAGPVATTDDQGTYRIDGLEAGQYLVEVPVIQNADPNVAAATGPDGRIIGGRYAGPVASLQGQAMAYTPTFYPEVPMVSEASTIELAAGEERANVDVRMRARPAFRVEGVIAINPGVPATSLIVRIVPAGLESMGRGSEIAVAGVHQDHTFAVCCVPAGVYTVDVRRVLSELEFRPSATGSASLPWPAGLALSSMASTPISGTAVDVSMTTRGGPGGELWWARTALEVTDRDVSDLRIEPARAGSLSGTFVWDTPSTGKAFPAAVRLEPADGDPGLGMPRSVPRSNNAEFRLDGLMPGRYVLRVTGNFRIKSVRWNEQEYTERPLDIRNTVDIVGVSVTLTGDTSELSGMVRVGRDVPSRIIVLAFPATPGEWADYGFSPSRIAATIADGGSNAYRFHNLPAGDYDIVAVPAPLPTAWMTPEILKQASRGASTVSLGWTGAVRRDLDLQPALVR